MSVSIDVVLDLAEAENAANKFQKEFIASAKIAAEGGVGALKEFAGKSDAEFQKLYQAYRKKVEEESKRIRDIVEAEGQALRKQYESDYQETIRNSERAARERIKDEERVAEETKRYLKEVERENERALKERGSKMESFANNVRGFVGDVGDAVGALGKGFLGLSDSQQVVADKTIYMTEKGMALGGALGSIAGPLGTLVGSGIGAGIGGLLGYFAGNSEAATIEAEKLKKEMKEQEAQLKRTLVIWANADKVKQGVVKLAEAWDMLEKDIKKTIDAEDLSKVKSEELTRRQKGAKEVLGKALDGFGKKRQELSQLETDIERAKAAEYKDNEEREKAVAVLEKEKIEREEEMARVMANVSVQQEEYTATTAELESRTKKGTKAVKDQSKELKKDADEWAKFVAEFDAEYDAILQAKQDRYEQDLAIIAALDQKYQENLSKITKDYQTKKATIAIDIQTTDIDKQAAEIEAYANTVNSALDSIGQMSMDAIGGVATDAFNSWLEAVATGEKDAEKSFKKIAAAAIRNIGSELVADGVKNILQGSANLIMGRPAGGALVAIGGAEIAAGVGMGAAGARAQRRQGYGDENKTSSTSGTLGKAGNANAGTQVQAPSIINLGLLAITDQRQLEQAGKQIAQAQSAYAQGRR